MGDVRMMANKMFEMDDYMEILFCIYLHMNSFEREQRSFNLQSSFDQLC
jgi:hypothetical protein